MNVYNYNTDERIIGHSSVSKGSSYYQILNLEEGQKYYFIVNSNGKNLGNHIAF